MPGDALFFLITLAFAFGAGFAARHYVSVRRRAKERLANGSYW
jgi:hypothetical protein